MGQLRGHRLRAGTPEGFAPSDGTRRREHLQRLGGHLGRDLPEEASSKIFERDLARLAGPDDATDDLVRLAEGHPTLGEKVREVGGGREIAVDSHRHPLGLPVGGLDHPVDEPEGVEGEGERVEEGGLSSWVSRL